MTNIRITQDMTPEEKKLARREYMRQYMTKRRAEDPEFLAKQNELSKERVRRRRENDPDYRERDRKYHYDKYHKYKDAYKQVREQLAQSK
tara:strand:+ start:614 stop:883 length:270 start_codon:yes stop_codon:yes gene_type:complete